MRCLFPQSSLLPIHALSQESDIRAWPANNKQHTDSENIPTCSAVTGSIPFLSFPLLTCTCMPPCTLNQPPASAASAIIWIISAYQQYHVGPSGPQIITRIVALVYWPVLLLSLLCGCSLALDRETVSGWARRRFLSSTTVRGSFGVLFEAFLPRTGYSTDNGFIIRAHLIPTLPFPCHAPSTAT